MRCGIPQSALDEWPERDVALALAELAIEADTGRYGESLTEATAPGADPSDYTSGYRYVVPKPRINWAERAVDDAIEEFKKTLPKDARMPAGLSWTAVKETFVPLDEEFVEPQVEQQAYTATRES